MAVCYVVSTWAVISVSVWWQLPGRVPPGSCITAMADRVNSLWPVLVDRVNIGSDNGLFPGQGPTIT